MKFQSEFELVELLKKRVAFFSNSENLKVSQEVNLGHGIADLVLTELKNIDEEKPKNREALNSIDINILIYIQQNENTCISGIIDETKIQKSKVKRSLNKLQNQAYINVSETEISICKTYESLFIQNWAIEAKLKNWKRALQQAYRYRWFAEYSYVVLDQHYSSSALDNLCEFQKLNVGLASINTEGKVQIHFKPQIQKPFDEKMTMLFSERIRTAL